MATVGTDFGSSEKHFDKRRIFIIFIVIVISIIDKNAVCEIDIFWKVSNSNMGISHISDILKLLDEFLDIY